MAIEQPNGQSTQAGDARELLFALLRAAPSDAPSVPEIPAIPAVDDLATTAPASDPSLEGSRSSRRATIPDGLGKPAAPWYPAVAPPALRSIAWLDPLLQGVQRFLIVLALLFLGRWLADGPANPTLRDRQAAPVIEAVPAAARFDPHAVTQAAAPTAPEGEFQAQRLGLPSAQLDVAAPPTRLQIPSIKIDTPIKEVFVVDFEWQVAEYAAGYLHGSGLPGDPGNMAFAGHAGLYGGVFRDLGALAPGADVFVDAAGWRYRYRVRESKAVWPDDLAVLDPTPTATLTLLTCTNWDTQRLVVVADLVAAKPLPGV